MQRNDAAQLPGFIKALRDPVTCHLSGSPLQPLFVIYAHERSLHMLPRTADSNNIPLGNWWHAPVPLFDEAVTIHITVWEQGLFATTCPVHS
jgi:hypothetical protein